MTFKQAHDLKAQVRKGEQGSLVVYADKIIRTETITTQAKMIARQLKREIAKRDAVRELDA
jgi:antirestriction protein ArdC